MKILLVHPGADFSVADVCAGLGDAFERQGVDLIRYNLSGRWERSASYIRHIYKKAQKEGLDVPRPNDADVQYLASIGILERALRHKPDWVFIVSAMYFHPDAIIMLRRAGMRVAVLFTESPYDDGKQIALAPYLDAIWVNERTSVAKFREVNPRTWYYQHALDADKHTPDGDGGEDVPAHDVVFVGTGFQERIDLLSAVDWSGIDLGLYGTWTLLGPRARLRAHLKGKAIRNAKTAALYRRAKVGLNLHRTSVGFGKYVPKVEGAESIGPRCYELAATGTFFVSDYRKELADVFGTVVPTFNTAAELGEVVRYYLAHEAERESIAAQLPALVKPHTFDARAAQILGVLNGLDRNS